MRNLSMIVYLIFMFSTTLVAGLYGGLRKGFAMRKITSFGQGFKEGFVKDASIVAVFETGFFIYFWFTLWSKI
nr:MAG TPA: hypothetical protein [Caudoviricetes sp.]